MVLDKNKANKWATRLLAAAFFLPLIYTPGVLFPYQYGKVLLFEIFIGIAAALWLISSKKLAAKVSPIFWVFFVFVAVRLITGFWGDNPEKSFWGDHIRMTGTFTYIFFFLFFALLREMFGNGREYKLLNLAAISGVLGAVIAVFQRYTAVGGSILGRSGDWLYGSFGNPSYLAGYLLMAIFFTALYLRTQNNIKKRIFWAAVILAELVLLIATSTRGAIVGIFSGIVVAGIFILLASKNKLRRIAAIAGIILPIMAILGSLFIYFGPGRESAPGRILGSLLRANTAETRILNWKIALDGFKAKPFLGWGPENYEIVFSKFYRPELINYTWNETWSDRPHNIILEVATGSGVLGLVSYFLLFAAPLLILFRAARFGKFSVVETALCAGGLIAFLAQGCFFFDTFGTLLLFAALLAFVDLRFWKASADFPQVKSNGTDKLSFFKESLAGLILIFVVFGAILPVRASYYANKTAKDLATKDYASFKGDFVSALHAWTPHKDDIAKIFADDVLKGDNAGVLPTEVAREILPELAEYLKQRADAHQDVYAVVLRSAQVYSLAGEYVSPQYFDKSEEMFKRADDLSPLRQTGIISHALLYTVRGEYAKAAELTGSLLGEDIGNAEVFLMHGTALYALGDMDGAETMFDKLVSLSPIISASSKASIWRRNSMVLDFYASRGKIDKMVPILEALAKEPNFSSLPEVHLRLAAVYTALGRYDEARAEGLKTIVLDPAKRADVEELIGALEDLSTRP